MESGTTYGSRLRQAMKRAGIKQQDIADKFGVSRGAVSQWKTDTTNPSTERSMLLAEYLQVDPAWLAFGTGSIDGPTEPTGPTELVELPEPVELRQEAEKEAAKPLPPIPDDSPAEVQLHAALSVAIFALDLIASHETEGGSFESHAAATALGILRRRHPIVAEHLPPR
jgi:transcriptional regulator with XRE-family HTH domain